MPDQSEERQIDEVIELDRLAQPLSQMPEQDRLTVCLQVSHEHRGDQPLQIFSTYHRLLETEEQPYQRRLTVTEQWESLDLGWVGNQNAGSFVLENLEGRHYSQMPTEEEKAAVANRIVYISFSSTNASIANSIKVMPGESVILTPVAPECVAVKCYKGKAKAKLTLFTR